SQPLFSNGPVFTYDAANDTFPLATSLGYSLTGSMTAVNRDGTLVAVEGNGVTTIYDRTMNQLAVLGYVSGGLAFDPVRDILYGVNAGLGQIIAYDTHTWQQLFHTPVGENITDPNDPSTPYGNGTVATNGDGTLLFLAT